MDHGYIAGRSLPPLSPSHAAASAEVAAFFAGGGRAAVLSGAAGTGKSAIVDHLIAGMPGRVLRVRNPGPAPLDLAAILHQLGHDPVDEADEQGLFFRTLAELAYEDYSAVLSIEDAHTLTAFSLSALSRVPGLGGPDLPGLILLLSGEPAMLLKLGAPGLEGLRNSRRTLLLKLKPSGGERQPARARPVGACPPAPGGRLSRRVREAGLVSLAAVCGSLATAALFAFLHGPAPDPQKSPDSPAVTVLARPAAVPVAPAALATAAPSAGGEVKAPDPVPLADGAALSSKPAAPVGPTPPDQQFRREFEAFLNRAGRDTAKLTPVARQALFEDYLRWRSRRGPDHPVRS